MSNGYINKPISDTIPIILDPTKVVEPSLKCDCMDHQTAVDIKLALISSRERIKGMSRLMEKDGRMKEVASFDSKADRITSIIERIEKMRPCQ